MKPAALSNISIRQKLTLLMMLTSGMALTVTGIALVAYELLTYRPRAVAELKAEADRLGYYAAPPIKFANIDAAVKTLEVLERHTHIVAAGLYNADGKLMASFQQTPGAPVALPSTVSGEGRVFGGGRLELTHAIVEDDVEIGFLVLVSNLGMVYARLGQQAGILAGAILLSTLASYLLSARLQPVIATPVLALAGAARRVRDRKDYSVRVEKTGQDEVGLLIDAFNQMLGTIQEHEKQLTEKRDELEMQVQARTAELSKAYAALQVNEEQLQSILDNTTSVIYIKDRDGRYLLINRRYERLFNITRDTIRGKTDYDLFPKDAADQFRKNDNTVAETGKVLQIEETVPQDDGLHTYLSVKFPLMDSANRVYATCGISTDITARKRAEEELRRSEAFTRNWLNETTDGIWDWNLETQDEYMSPRFKAMFGYADHEMPNHASSWQKIIHPDDLKLALQAFKEHTEEGKPFNIPVRYYHKNGSIVWVICRGVAIKNEQGKYVRMVGTHTDITRLKQVEEEIQESEQRFRRAVQFAPFPIMIHAEDGAVMMISDSWTQLTGYTRGEIPTTTAWTEHAYGEQHAVVKKVIDDLYAINAPVTEGEFEILAKDGRRMTWAFSSAPLGRGKDGRRLVMSMAMDVTDRKQAEAALRKSDELTRFWLNASTDGTWDWDLISDKVYLSPRFKEMFGYADNELENTAAAWHRIVHPDDLTLLLEAFRAHIEQGQRFNVPIRHRHKNGSIVWVICRGMALKDDDGRYHRMVGTVTDITRLKHIEESLRQSENAFRQTVMNAPMPSVVLPDTGEIILANRAWTDLSGYDTAETSTIQAWAEKALVENKESFLATFEDVRAIRGMGRMSEGQFRIRTKTGESRVWEFFASKLGKMPDRRRLFIIMAIDVTDRNRAEALLLAKSDELQRSNKELEQFAYIASHDLQEPLRTVGSFTQLLARKARGKIDPEADEFMDFIVDGAKRAQRLINDLLQYSRVGMRGKQFVDVDCNEVMKDALANLYSAITESQALINVGSLPKLRGDPTQLPQLFQNLVGNALKFKKHGETPRIDVSARRVNSDWEFTVADNGIGIAPQFFDRIFAIFQRLHRAEEYPGTGIGLAVCKRIVERHGGRIWVESEPGSGARFKFTIPVDAAAPHAISGIEQNHNHTPERSQP